MLALENRFLACCPTRSAVLIREFLPIGYRATTLDQVSSSRRNAVVEAKTILGAIITLYDDLADLPSRRNPELLREMYRINISSASLCPAGDRDERVELAHALHRALRVALSNFPGFARLEPVLELDIEQFYICNRHSELMGRFPGLANVTECKRLGPFNMSMTAAGTIDLMAMDGFVEHELGACREVFLIGQRLGRISNVISTFAREKVEGDVTNEISIVARCQGVAPERYLECLISEFKEGLREIITLEPTVESFSTRAYAEGLRALHELHLSMIGRI